MGEGAPGGIVVIFKHTCNSDEYSEDDRAECSLAAVATQEEGQHSVRQQRNTSQDPQHLHRQEVLSEIILVG